VTFSRTFVTGEEAAGRWRLKSRVPLIAAHSLWAETTALSPD